MNFDFSDDQRQVQEQLRKLLTDKLPLSKTREVLEGHSAFARDAWLELGALGYLGAAIPDRFGGSGLGYLELCILAEEAGRGVAPLPLMSSLYLGAEAIMLAGSEAQKTALLPEIASGGRIAAWAPAPACAWPTLESSLTWTRGKLNGTALPVLDGAVADYVIAPIDHNGERGLVIADLSGPGVRRAPVQTIDPTRPCARIDFDNTDADLLPESEGDPKMRERIQERAAVLMAFEQLGGADRALDMARNYALERHAFGRPIGSHQAIKHKLAEVYIKTQIARGHCYYGAWALSTQAPELPLAAAGARIAATQAFSLAAQENVQTHGGMGFSWESDCHLFYRRARMLSLVLGPLRLWKEKLVTLLESGMGIKEPHHEF